MRTCHAKVHKYLDSNGEPQVFENVAALNGGIIGQGVTVITSAAMVILELIPE